MIGRSSDTLITLTKAGHVGMDMISYEPTGMAEADNLVRIRISAMRESLEKIGRFDPIRARERFVTSFEPEHTQYILRSGVRVGFVVVKPEDDILVLHHLYIEPPHQNQGIGSAVLRDLFSRADFESKKLKLGALRESGSNRFYQKNEFEQVDESDWDIYYIRNPLESGAAS